MKQRHNHKKGFSLVEAAIVLAVVGLVVAGIWVAAASVNRRLKISRLASDMFAIVEATHRLVPYANYPTSWGSDNITSFARNAGIIPSDYDITGQYFPVGHTPSGIEIVLELACSSDCPILSLTVYAGHNFDRSDCINLLQSVVRPTNTSLMIAAVETGSSYNYYEPGDDPSGMDCPSNFGQIYFRYQPI